MIFSAYYFEVLHRCYVAMWPVLFWCSCMGDGAFRCSLYLSSNVLDDSPIYSSLQSILSHLNQYITLLFFLMLSLSLGDTSKFLSVFPPLKYTCIPYFLQMFLKLSAIPLEYGTTMWHIFFGDTGCCFFLLVLECVCLWRIFCIAHLGYLQPINAFSKCSNSFLVESGLEHSVLALCVRVLITIYLEAKLWLLSHWRYWHNTTQHFGNENYRVNIFPQTWGSSYVGLQKLVC